MRPADDDWVHAEILEVGPPDGRSPGPGARPLWPLLALGAVVVTVAVLALRGTGGQAAAAAPTPSARPTSSAGAAGTGAPGASGAASSAGQPLSGGAATPLGRSSGGSGSPDPEASAALVVTTPRHPVAGVPAGFELFGLGQGQVVHLQPGAGRATVTTVPGLVSIVTSFVATRSAVLVRPFDSGGVGYLVPDGAPAQQTGGILTGSGPMLPGPDPQHVWIEVPGTPGLVLVGIDGSRTGSRLALPAEVPVGALTPDGAGGAVASGVGGVYDIRPDGLHRITSGSLLAIGPAGFLTVDCDARHVCTDSLVSRDGTSRPVPGPPLLAFAGIGQISPDGRTAAVFPDSGTGIPSLALIDLTTGRLRTVTLDNPHAGQDAIVWTPDSQRLFALDGSARLHVVDVRAATSSLVDATLPEIYQLVTRLPLT